MTGRKRADYTKEFRDHVVERLLQEGISARKLSYEIGVCQSTISKWLKAANTGEVVLRVVRPSNEGWSSEDKFHAVMETYGLNEAEIAEYCRRKGIYPEQLQEWRKTCQQANAQQAAMHQQLRTELREEKQSKAALAKELRRKEKALAEAAALLVLRKKAEAIWGDPEEE